MVALTEQQRELVAAEAGKPVPFVDDQTRRVYYLVSAEQFARVQALLADEPFDPAELYPLIAQTAAMAGWNDPAMDAYDRYDEHRP